MNQFVCEAADAVRARLCETPQVGLILGSGLGGIAEKIEQPVFIP